MICYILAMGKQHLGLHVVVGYGIKIFWPGLFVTRSPGWAYFRSNSVVFFQLWALAMKITVVSHRK